MVSFPYRRVGLLRADGDVVVSVANNDRLVRSSTVDLIAVSVSGHGVLLASKRIEITEAAHRWRERGVTLVKWVKRRAYREGRYADRTAAGALSRRAADARQARTAIGTALATKNSVRAGGRSCCSQQYRSGRIGPSAVVRPRGQASVSSPGITRCRYVKSSPEPCLFSWKIFM